MIHKRLREFPAQGIDPGSKDDVGRRRKIAFLDLLLQIHREDQSFTLQHIQEEVDTFMFEVKARYFM